MNLQDFFQASKAPGFSFDLVCTANYKTGNCTRESPGNKAVHVPRDGRFKGALLVGDYAGFLHLLHPATGQLEVVYRHCSLRSAVTGILCVQSYLDLLIICDFERDILVVRDGKLLRKLDHNLRLGRGTVG